ncbi:MAG: serine/threonine protein kinase, partial [Planctomycetota bacterium]
MTLDRPLDETTFGGRAQRLLAEAPVPAPSAALAARLRSVARDVAQAWTQGTLPAGSRVGPYEVLGLIARGGQATVYRARGEDGRLYALKIPHGALLDRLVREAQILFVLDHPHVLRIERAVVDGEIPFLATEFLPAGSLTERLRERGGRLPEAEALALAREVLEALRYAHSKGVVHRDLKPSNILFDDGGRVKVADFGIGSLRLVGELGTIDGTLLSREQTLVAGTPLYMAPEQELPGEPVDARADLYALGKLLYQALTGRSPRTIQPLSRVAPELAPRWEEFLFRLLEDDPAARYASAEEARSALEDARAAPAAEREGDRSAEGVGAEEGAPGGSPAKADAPEALWKPIVRPDEMTVREVERAFARLPRAREAALAFLPYGRPRCDFQPLRPPPTSPAAHVQALLGLPQDEGEAGSVSCWPLSSKLLLKLLAGSGRPTLALVRGRYLVGTIAFDPHACPRGLARRVGGVVIHTAPGTRMLSCADGAVRSAPFPPRLSVSALAARGLVSASPPAPNRKAPSPARWALPAFGLGAALGLALGGTPAARALGALLAAGAAAGLGAASEPLLRRLVGAARDAPRRSPKGFSAALGSVSLLLALLASLLLSGLVGSLPLPPSLRAGLIAGAT